MNVVFLMDPLETVHPTKDTTLMLMVGRWDRYAFSCEESIVYTAVGRGEFEPGRPAYIRKYDWRVKKIIAGPGH